MTITTRDAEGSVTIDGEALVPQPALTLRDAVALDAITTVAVAVADLERELPAITDACTDPQALDLAELFYDVQAARIALQGVERDLEAQLGKALLSDEVHTPQLRVERYRSSDRKAWDHETWRKDVRTKVLQAHGLKGAQVVTADGELLDAGALHQALTAVQDAQGAGAPKVTALRGLGLDPRDYCETTPGTVHVRVQRVAGETAQGGGE